MKGCRMLRKKQWLRAVELSRCQDAADKAADDALAILRWAFIVSCAIVLGVGATVFLFVR